jgi:hypothetical protein
MNILFTYKKIKVKSTKVANLIDLVNEASDEIETSSINVVFGLGFSLSETCCTVLTEPGLELSHKPIPKSKSTLSPRPLLAS